MEENVRGWKSARLGYHQLAKKFFVKQLYSGLRLLSKNDNGGREFDCLTPEEMRELCREIRRSRPTTESYSDDLEGHLSKLTISLDNCIVSVHYLQSHGAGCIPWKSSNLRDDTE